MAGSYCDLDSLESNSIHSEEGALKVDDPQVANVLERFSSINDALYKLQNRFALMAGLAADKLDEGRRCNGGRVPVLKNYVPFSNPGIGRGAPVPQHTTPRPAPLEPAPLRRPYLPSDEPQIMANRPPPPVKPMTVDGSGAAVLQKPSNEPQITVNGPTSVKPLAQNGSGPPPLRRPHFSSHEPQISVIGPPPSAKPVVENGSGAAPLRRPSNEPQITENSSAPGKPVVANGSGSLTQRRPNCPPKGLVKPPPIKIRPPNDGFLPPPMTTNHNNNVVNNNNNNNVVSSPDSNQSSSLKSPSSPINQTRILPPPPKPKLLPPAKPRAGSPLSVTIPATAAAAQPTSAPAKPSPRPPPPPYSKIKQLLESAQLNGSGIQIAPAVLQKQESRPEESPNTGAKETFKPSAPTTPLAKPRPPVTPVYPRSLTPPTSSNTGTTRRSNEERNTSLGSNSLFQSFSLKDYLVDCNYRKGEKTIKTKLEFEVTNLDRPIGLTVLSDGNVVVAVSGTDQVHMYDGKGKLIKKLTSNRPFRRPTDMINLQNGFFAIRDDDGVQIFKDDGTFSRVVGKDIFARCFGLATDGQGHLIVINYGSRQSKLTKPGQTDVLFINVETGKVTRRIELEEVITDKSKSKCRFLSCDGKRLYVVDLGLDCIYAINMSKTAVRTFGGSGRLGGLFSDPAGMAIDKSGNLIIADAGNHRLQIFDKTRKFLGLVNTTKPLRRPSGIAFDSNSASLFVLNLHSSSMTKYTFIPN